MDALQLGVIRQVGPNFIRNFKGYAQTREGTHGAWLFCVTGFDGTVAGQPGRCSVLLASGAKVFVPIDASDQITVGGRKYGRSRWSH